MPPQGSDACGGSSFKAKQIKISAFFRYFFAIGSRLCYNVTKRRERGTSVATSTKNMLAAALKKMMEIKPIDKITVKDLVELCSVNRQTFYYHFDDVYDLLEWVFEEDANRVLPKEIVYDNWQQDVVMWFKYLSDNSAFALNVYNSNNRLYMLRYIKGRLQSCIRAFADIVSEGISIDKMDYEFVIEFYSSGIVGLISQWMDLGMNLPKEVTKERLLRIMDNSVENMLMRFQNTQII